MRSAEHGGIDVIIELNYATGDALDILVAHRSHNIKLAETVFTHPQNGFIRAKKIEIFPYVMRNIFDR